MVTVSGTCDICMNMFPHSQLFDITTTPHVEPDFILNKIRVCEYCKQDINHKILELSRVRSRC